MKFSTSLLFVLLVSLASCTTEEKKPVPVPVQAEKLFDPFHFHKAVEVKPGLTFDILSWGRGSEYIGEYLILRSDSTKAQYKSISGELEGLIVDAWNMDHDADGNPEIYIQAKGGEKDGPLKMYVYEFTSSGSSSRLRFPELTSNTRKQYRGRDSVYIKDGVLMREFPIFDASDTAGVKRLGKKVIEYSLRGNVFSVSDAKDTMD